MTIARVMKPNVKQIRVAIVEDDEAFRGSIEQMLGSACNRFSVCGSLADAEAALCELPTLVPDVVLMDIHLPSTSGVECVRRLAAELPNTQFMMLTVSEDTDLVFDSIRAGATGYLVKRDVFEKLFTSIITLHEGGSPMSNSIARKVMVEFKQLAPPSPAAKILTEREEQILAALGKGALYKEIAADFHISFHTVRAHVRKIYKKLQATSRAAAIRNYTNRGPSLNA